jgi:predicted dehydrogenase
MTVRIGCLGAAKIANNALCKPALTVPAVDVVAIAARDRARAQAMASKRGIPKVHASYADLLADDDLDAIYVPLPNGLHAEWTIKALEAGKHVLCEKPFTANADEAERVAEVARSTGLVVMEAFHWRYHPLAARVLDLIDSQAIGEVRNLDVAFCFPLPARGDIRWQLDLAGGAFMDAGCYAVHRPRTFGGGGGEPTVTGATARERSPGVDATLRAELRFPTGATATVTGSMWSIPRIRAVITGDRGTIKILNPLAPHLWHRLTVSNGSGKRSEKVGGRSTYRHQLEAFAAAVEHGTPFPTGVDDAIANMRVIDAAYLAAGLGARSGSRYTGSPVTPKATAGTPRSRWP